MKKVIHKLHKLIFCVATIGVISSPFSCILATETTDGKNFVDIEAPAGVVIDMKSGRVLFDKNADEKRPMASLTKVMTSIMLVENCDMEEMIEVPSQAVWIGGSTVGLKKGDKVSAKSLLYGMLLPSGNDCAYTVGIHIGGTIENFADMMTKKAREIGLVNTSFANPHGLDNENHYTTAKEMALIARYALNNKLINEVVKTTSITVNFGSFSKLLNNTNALLRTYSKADGVKTGFTNGANRCLVASATNGPDRYIGVILGAETTKIRFSNAQKILEASFQKYINTDISNFLNFYINIPVKKGNIDYYERKMSDTLSLPLSPEEYEKIYVKQDLIQEIVPPMEAGTKIGEIKVVLGDEVLYEKEYFLEESITKKTMKNYIVDGLKTMFNTLSTI